MAQNETMVTVIGNLTADPELRFTASGDPVVGFTIASTPRVYNKQTGVWDDGDTLFMRCSAWRRMAENIAETLTTGMRVVAHGALRQRSYEKDGETRTVVEMRVDEIGVSLQWATAKVSRNAPKAAGQPWPQQSQGDPLGPLPVPDAPPF